jgi:hypothetical protein
VGTIDDIRTLAEMKVTNADDVSYVTALFLKETNYMIAFDIAVANG